MSERVLSAGQRNRALLARQPFLERDSPPILRELARVRELAWRGGTRSSGCRPTADGSSPIEVTVDDAGFHEE